MVTPLRDRETERKITRGFVESLMVRRDKIDEVKLSPSHFFFLRWQEKTTAGTEGEGGGPAGSVGQTRRLELVRERESP